MFVACKPCSKPSPPSSKLTSNVRIYRKQKQAEQLKAGTRQGENKMKRDIQSEALLNDN